MRIKRDIIEFTILFILVFQSVLEKYISFFAFFDELLAIIFFLIGVYANGRKGRLSLKKNETGLTICVFTYCVLGFFSSVIYHYQSAITTTGAFFVSIKWFLAFYGFRQLYSGRYLRKINQVNIRVLELVTCLMGIYVLLTLTGMPNIYSFDGWDLCAKCVFMIGLFMCNWEKKWISYSWIIVLWILIFLTGRSKGYAAVLLSAAIFIWVIHMGKEIRLREIIALGIVLAVVVWEKIYIYFIWGAQHGYARSTLFLTSFKIANDYFPLGTGWGTFCSYYAAKEYSPVYFSYGISEHPELGVQTKLYLQDAYWPAVIAETGWLGIVAILGVFLILFLEVKRLYRIDTKLYAAGMLLLIYMGITTIEETGFMQPVLMCIGILMAAIVGTRDRIIKKDGDKKWSVSKG